MPASDLLVSVNAAPNFIVDSNLKSGPTAAYVTVSVTNAGTDELKDVVLYAGDFTNSGASGGTPGVYPQETSPSYAGNLSLKHEGGPADAVRLLGSLAPGQTVVQYFLLSYPWHDDAGQSTFGAHANNNDDLVLQYDLWAKATDPIDGPLTTAVTQTATLREEISAMANKIWPNTTSKVPDEYLAVFQQQLGWRPDQIAPGTARTQGIWYDFGRVNQGFDADANLVPDYDVWSQPIGDPSAFDPNAWRLVRSYGVLIVKLNDGTEQIIAFRDQLYHKDLPANNTGVVGLVYYEFAPIGVGPGQLSPYQEAASGSNNEKFNGDFGTFVGGPTGTPPSATFDKVGPATVSPNTTVTYDLTATNTGTTPFGLNEFAVPAVISDIIPTGTQYVAGSADDNLTLPAGVTAQIYYSTDGGTTWSSIDPGAATTNIQWWLSAPLAPGQSATVHFQVLIPAGYSQTQVYNTGGVGLGNAAPLYTDSVNSFLAGTHSISGLVFRDDGTGGGTTGDGTRQSGETTFLGSIDVTLYPDTDGDGVLDPSEATTPRATVSSTGGTGVWSFSNLPDGNYLVQVKRDDPQRPTGFVLSTAETFAVTISGGDEGGYEFGFAPTLDVQKTLLSPTPVLEGTQITYSIDTTNLLKPDGYVSTTPTVSNLWLETTAGSTFATTPANAAGAPDGAFASSSTNGQMLVGDYVAPHPAAPAAAVAKVEAVVSLNLSTTLSSDTLLLTVRRNGATVGTITLDQSQLHAFVGTTGLVAIDVTTLAAWTWSDFQTTSTGLTLTINGGGSIPTFSVDAFGFRVTTGSRSSPSGNVFWTDTTTALEAAPTATAPATELDSYLRGLPAVPTEIAFDETAGKMYIAYASLGIIEARNLDGTGATTLVSGLGTDISGLAVDGVHGYIYWARAGSTDTINRRNLDGSGTTLTLTGLANPEGVAIDPVSAQVYWVETQGASLRIRRSDLDFSTASIIDLFTPTTIGSGNHNPRDLEIDPIRRKLYWADDKSGTNDDFIGVVNLDGTEMRQFITQADAALGDNPVGIGIDVLGGFLYWSDSTGIKRASVTGSSAVLLSGLSSLGDVEVPGTFSSTGTFDADKTLSVVPLTDDYDPAELRFVSASVAPTSVDTVNGLISWANIGPIHADATRTILVTFEVLEPPGNATNTAVDNTATVSNALIANGLLATDDTSNVVITVEPTATIGDVVWSNRVTADGIQEAGEPGIPGVKVDLYDSTGTTRLQTTTTDATGHYFFKGVTGTAGGTQYIVRIDRTTLPGGLSATNTSDPDGGTAHESLVTITDPAGATGPADNLGQDFGYTVPNVFFGVLYQDFDSDGTRDATDTALAGVTVQLLDGGGTTIATTTTDVNGAYRLTANTAGSYRVVVDRATLPSPTWSQTADPDATLDDRNTTLISVTTGEVSGAHDFGYHRSGISAIGDEVFLDPDGDNVKDLNESGIPNVTVWLYADLNTNGVLEASIDGLVATTVTNANGIYSFTGLAAGRYLVVVDEQDPQFPGNVMASASNPRAVDLPAATTLSNVDFGYRPASGFVETATIGDLVYFDANRNGEQDYNEVGIGGVTLRLYSDVNNNQTYDAGVDIDYGTTTTSLGGAGNPPAGFYLFTDLAPDSNPNLPGNNPYTVQVLTIPASTGTALDRQTADPNRDGVPAWDNTYLGLPAADNQDTGVWRDLNANNIRDAGETGIFVNAGTHYAGADFGYQPTGVVGDYVWLDLNNNGRQDFNEIGLSGVAVSITNIPFGGSTTLNTTTDPDGLYSFQGLTVGTWQITVTPPAGFAPSTRVDADLLAGIGTVGASTAVLTIDSFGNVTQITIGGSTLNFSSPYEDDGVKIDFGYRPNGTNDLLGKVVLEQQGATDGNSGEASDVAVSGVTVFLYDGTGTMLGSTVTDASGNYLFANLANGTYSISMVANVPMLANTTLTTDDFAPGSVPAGTTVSGNDNSAVLTLTVSGDVSGLDFAWVRAVNYDFGDLPDSYATRLASNGARHIITGVPTLYLGSVAPDTEADGPSVAGATGDDGAGTADEDGVTVLAATNWTEGTGSSATNSLRVVVNGTGWLVAWVDFDGDGTFLDANETIIDQAVSTGTFDFAVEVPAGTFVGGGAVLNSRFRLFDEQPLVPEAAFLGVVTGGEVEDHLLIVGTPDLTNLSLSGLVYSDANNDGIKQAGEAGIAGVTVTLTGTDDLGNAVNRTTTTDGNGLYTFDALRPSSAAGYTITETQPAGFLDGQDTIGTQGGSSGNDSFSNVVVLAGTNGTNYNFGELAPTGSTSLSGFVYDDADNDGVRDAGEAGLGGVTITLLDGNGNELATTTTAPDGSYSMGNLPPGSSTLVQTQPNGYGSSTPNSVSVTLSAGTPTLQDFGETTASLSGSVFADLNNNGVLNGVEGGIAGVVITLSGTDVNGVTVNRTTSTAADGTYRFTGLLAGTYTLTETQPGGYFDGRDTVGSAGGTPGNDQISAIILGAGVNGSGYHFAEVPPADPIGFVYVDANNNGIRDPGEAGIAGVVIRLTGTDVFGAAVNLLQMTDVNGRYQFAGLAPGGYALREVQQPAGFLDGREQNGSPPAATVLNDEFRGIDLTSAPFFGSGYNFGELRPSSLSGSVYVDANNNGIRDLREAGIAGARVRLIGTDDRGNAVSVTTRTNGGGQYTFANLRPGTYRLWQTQPAGFLDGRDRIGTQRGTAANDQFFIALGAGVVGTNNTFGELRPARLSGRVYQDANGNGRQDRGERGLAGVLVTLIGTDQLGNAVRRTVRTAADGSYTFANLRPGVYSIQVSPPTGYRPGRAQAGSLGGSAGVNRLANIRVREGANGVAYNFGEISQARLGKWWFLGSNGLGRR